MNEWTRLVTLSPKQIGRHGMPRRTTRRPYRLPAKRAQEHFLIRTVCHRCGRSGKLTGLRCHFDNISESRLRPLCFRRQDHHHLAAFETRLGLYLGNLFGVAFDLHEKISTELLVGHFATAEP